MKHINFMAARKVAVGISLVLVLVSLLSLFFNSLRLGLDFTSGAAILLHYPQSVEPGRVTAMLQANGFDDVQVVNFGSDHEVRIVLSIEGATESAQAARAIELGDEITLLLSQAEGVKLQLVSSDFVSAKAGADLVERSMLGILAAMGMIMLYVTMRFEIKFALGAVASLLHDVIITLGVFSLFRIQFDLTVLAALLAVIGYSLNDTIIVADRVRENFRRARKGGPEELINLSLNQTLSRTLITSGTTLIVVLTMLLVGGEAVRGFAIALCVGILVGTYSSIYIACSVALMMHLKQEDYALPVKEGAEMLQP